MDSSFNKGVSSENYGRVFASNPIIFDSYGLLTNGIKRPEISLNDALHDDDNNGHPLQKCSASIQIVKNPLSVASYLKPQVKSILEHVKKGKSDGSMFEAYTLINQANGTMLYKSPLQSILLKQSSVILKRCDIEIKSKSSASVKTLTRTKKRKEIRLRRRIIIPTSSSSSEYSSRSSSCCSQIFSNDSNSDEKEDDDGTISSTTENDIDLPKPMKSIHSQSNKTESLTTSATINGDNSNKLKNLKQSSILNFFIQRTANMACEDNTPSKNIISCEPAATSDPIKRHLKAVLSPSLRTIIPCTPQLAALDNRPNPKTGYDETPAIVDTGRKLRARRKILRTPVTDMNKYLFTDDEDEPMMTIKEETETVAWKPQQQKHGNKRKRNVRSEVVNKGSAKAVNRKIKASSLLPLPPPPAHNDQQQKFTTTKNTQKRNLPLKQQGESPPRTNRNRSHRRKASGQSGQYRRQKKVRNPPSNSKCWYLTSDETESSSSSDSESFLNSNSSSSDLFSPVVVPSAPQLPEGPCNSRRNGSSSFIPDVKDIVGTVKTIAKSFSSILSINLEKFSTFSRKNLMNYFDQHKSLNKREETMGSTNKNKPPAQLSQESEEDWDALAMAQVSSGFERPVTAPRVQANSVSYDVISSAIESGNILRIMNAPHTDSDKIPTSQTNSELTEDESSEDESSEEESVTVQIRSVRSLPYGHKLNPITLGGDSNTGPPKRSPLANHSTSSVQSHGNSSTSTMNLCDYENVDEAIASTPAAVRASFYANNSQSYQASGASSASMADPGTYPTELDKILEDVMAMEQEYPHLFVTATRPPDSVDQAYERLCDDVAMFEAFQDICSNPELQFPCSSKTACEKK